MASSLHSLVQDWRRHRDPHLADRIDALSDRLAAQEPPRAACEWFQGAVSTDALTSLLPALPSTGHAFLGACLERLWAFPADPRIATALHRLVLQELPRSDDLAFWNRALALLAWLGDVRSADWLGAAIAEIDGPALATRTLILRVNELIVQLGSQPRPVAVTSGTHVDPLLTPPDDPAARLVFADQLTERGDVRGELIVLQTLPAPRREQRRRAAGIVRQYRGALLGRLRPALKPDGLRFERGVIVAGRLSGYRAIPSLVGAPEWRSIVELDLRELRQRRPRGSALVELLTHPVLGRLRVLRHFPVNELAALRAWQRPTSIRELHVVGWSSPSQLEGLRRRPALPQLELLTYNGRAVDDTGWPVTPAQA